MSEHIEWTLRLATPGGPLIAILILVGSLAVVVAGLWELRGMPRARRWSLGALRVVSACGIALLGLQPSCSGQRSTQVEGRLALLTDVSRSMSVKRGDGPSRGDQAQALLRRWHPNAPTDLEVYRFGQETAVTDLTRLGQSYPTLDDTTRLLDALHEVMDLDRSEELGAIVVVSDGADHSSRDTLEALARRKVRIHTVSVGDARPLPDRSIVDVRADRRAFLREPTRVEVVLRASGGLAGKVPVTLRKGGEVVRQVEVELREGELTRAQIEFVPTRLGTDAYQVSIPDDPRDAIAENDQRAFLLDVVRDRLRVLLVCGHPSWDARFLRAHLKSDPSIDLITFFILRTTHDIIEAAPEELSLIPFPTDELFDQHLGSFDVVIFQDFEFGPYRMARHLPRIRDYVRSGGAFAMLGGERSLASGGYAGTAVAEILPVLLPPKVHARLSEASFTPRIAEAARWHPLLAWYPEAEAQYAVWRRLAPLIGMNLVKGARPGAAVLLEHPSLKTEAGEAMPLLTLDEPGEGRSLVLATDAAWRWGFATAGRAGDASAYALFWDRALRWLTRDPSLEPTQIMLQRAQVGPGAALVMRAQVRDARHAPLALTDFEVSVVAPQGKVLSVQHSDSGPAGIVETRLEAPVVPGAYRIRIRRATEGAPVLAERGFIVDSGGDELAEPHTDHGWLVKLAEHTGGGAHQSADAPELRDLTTARTRILGTVERKPFSEVWYILLLLSLLVGDWAARRAWGRA